jgi:Zn-dependent protease with chaperone function
MDFFEQQDQAHRESKKLLFLFVLAVIAIILTVNVSLALIWKLAYAQQGAPVVYPKYFFWVNSFLTLLFIVGGTLVEIFRLRDGGDAVAQMAGGRLISSNSADREERRLLNIVEEMSLASGIACPNVYVMDREDAINAFAAGYHQNEAVVAVTRGTLMRLNRDELQGVIGHEFSHILNGDMRLNIRLIGVLFGIQMLSGFGQELLYWGSRFGSARTSESGGKSSGPPIQLVILAFGAVLFVVGYVGIFFGRLIKSAVSRQREFLADASAVQFTRNPDGIGGALRKIGGLTIFNDCGSRIDNPHAEQFSHMFLGAARPNLLSGLFATHPPIEERLQRIFGRQVAMLDASEIVEPVQEGSPRDMYGYGSHFAGDVGAQTQGLAPLEFTLNDAPQAASSNAANTFLTQSPLAATSPMQTATTKPDTANSIPTELISAARDPAGARALLYALLLDSTQGYDAQLTILSTFASTQRAAAMFLHDVLGAAPHVARLSLLDLAMPALKTMDAAQRKETLAVVHKLIAADGRMTQAEFVLQTVLDRRLGAHAGRAVPIRYNTLKELKDEAGLLVVLMANTVAASNGDASQNAIRNAVQSQPELGLIEADLMQRQVQDFFEVKLALEKLNQLAPLAKPFLIRLLVATAGKNITTEAAELLRGVCAAIDAPMPELK